MRNEHARAFDHGHVHVLASLARASTQAEVLGLILSRKRTGRPLRMRRGVHAAILLTLN